MDYSEKKGKWYCKFERGNSQWLDLSHYKFKILQLAAGDIKYDTNGTVQATKICEATATFSDSNTSRYKPMSFDGSVALAQGDMLIPMIKNTDGDYSANTHFSFSFSIKV